MASPEPDLAEAAATEAAAAAGAAARKVRGGGPPRHALPLRRADILENTAAFDADWYARTYPDVGLLGMEPRRHYLAFGCFLGRGISAAAPRGGQVRRLATALKRPREISYCIPVMNRPDDIRGTLPRNLHANAEWRDTIEFVVVFFDRDRATQDWVRAAFAEELADGYLRLVAAEPLDGWHFGKAKNAFREVATGAVYSSLDGDNFVTAEETRTLLDIHARHGGAFVFHHFSGRWGDGSSGRVSLPMALYRAVGYDERFLPRQYDEMDMIVSAAMRFPKLPVLRHAENPILQAGRSGVFAREAALANPLVTVAEPKRRLRPLNPKTPDYVTADPVIRAMQGFNQALCYVKNAPTPALRAKYLKLAVEHRHRLVDAVPGPALVEMLFEAPFPAPLVAPGEVCLLACMKDDEAYLEAFAAHYRGLGVAHLLIVDDGSAVPVAGRLAGADVHVFRPKVGTFAAAKGLWLEALIKAFLAPGAWMLTVDADEFLDLPPPHGSLAGLVAALEARGAGFAPGLLLDMLPRAELDAGALEDPADFAGRFDAHAWVETEPATDYARHPSVAWGFGPHAGLSWRVDARFHAFGTFDSLRKLPLVQVRPERHLNQGFHTLHPTDGTAAPGPEIWEAGPVLPIRHYKLAKLFSEEGRRRTLAKIAGRPAYHGRTTENIGRIFGHDPGEALARLAALPRRTYDRATDFTMKARPCP
jgi:Glycosyl transferase family 2